MANMMKAAVWKAPGRVIVERIPIPEVGANDVLIKVLTTGICGSDLHSFKLGFYIQPGQVLGHEFAGEVAKIGAAVENLKIGDLVTGFNAGVCGACYWCRRNDYSHCPDLFKKSTGYGLPGAMAEYVLISNAMLGASIFKLPPEMDAEIGATIEPTATAASAIAEISAGDKVVILGAGLIGNVILQGAKAIGADKVAVIEISPLRLKTAKEMGADAVFDARTGDALSWVKETIGIGPYHFNEGAMADVVIEAAGAPQTVTNAFEMVRSGGTIVFVGLPEKPALVDTTKIVHKAPKIVGILGGSTQNAIDLLTSGRINIRPLITHRFSLDEAQSAFETALRSDEAIKVMLKM